MANGWKTKDPYDDLNNALNLINTIQGMNRNRQAQDNALAQRHQTNMNRWIELASNDPMNQSHLMTMKSKLNSYIAENEGDFSADSIEFKDAANMTIDKMMNDNQRRISQEDSLKEFDTYFQGIINGETLVTQEVSAEVKDKVSKINEWTADYMTNHYGKWGKNTAMIDSLINRVKFNSEAVLGELPNLAKSDLEAISRGHKYYSNVYLANKGKTLANSEKMQMNVFNNFKIHNDLIEEQKRNNFVILGGNKLNLDAPGGVTQFISGDEKDASNWNPINQGAFGGPVQLVAGDPSSEIDPSFITLPYLVKRRDELEKQLVALDKTYYNLSDGMSYLDELAAASGMDISLFADIRGDRPTFQVSDYQYKVKQEKDRSRRVEEGLTPEKEKELRTKGEYEETAPLKVSLLDNDGNLKLKKDIYSNILEVYPNISNNIAGGMANQAYYSVMKALRNPNAKHNIKSKIDLSNQVFSTILSKHQELGAIDVELDEASQKQYGNKTMPLEFGTRMRTTAPAVELPTPGELFTSGIAQGSLGDVKAVSATDPSVLVGNKKEFKITPKQDNLQSLITPKEKTDKDYSFEFYITKENHPSALGQKGRAADTAIKTKKFLAEDMPFYMGKDAESWWKKLKQFKSGPASVKEGYEKKLRQFAFQHLTEVISKAMKDDKNSVDLGGTTGKVEIRKADQLMTQWFPKLYKPMY